MYRSIMKFGLFGLLSMSASLTASASTMMPKDLRWGGSESNQIQVIEEIQKQHINSGSVFVDYLLGSNLSIGNSFTGVTHSNSGLMLNEGVYSSHLLHYDTVGKKSGTIRNTRFHFSGDIVAIILGGEYLKLSDALLGNAGTKYEQSISRRMETHDLFTLESKNTLLVNKLSVGASWIDDARVITQSVPEPGSWALFGMGLLGLFGARKLAGR